jgi:hypothetical protein
MAAGLLEQQLQQQRLLPHQFINYCIFFALCYTRCLLGGGFVMF